MYNMDIIIRKICCKLQAYRPYLSSWSVLDKRLINLYFNLSIVPSG